MQGKLTFANTVEQFDAGDCGGGVVEVLEAEHVSVRELRAISDSDRKSDKVVDAEQIKRVVSKNAKSLVFKTSTWD